VRFPANYTAFLSALQIAGLNLGLIVSADCWSSGGFSFYDELLAATLLPLGWARRWCWRTRRRCCGEATRRGARAAARAGVVAGVLVVLLLPRRVDGRVPDLQRGRRLRRRRLLAARRLLAVVPRRRRHVRPLQGVGDGHGAGVPRGHPRVLPGAGVAAPGVLARGRPSRRARAVGRAGVRVAGHGEAGGAGGAGGAVRSCWRRRGCRRT
jgi:hypothetical protein